MCLQACSPTSDGKIKVRLIVTIRFLTLDWYVRSRTFHGGKESMNMKAELGQKSPGRDVGGLSGAVSTRLRKLRRERALVRRAIAALTQISRARESRDRRGIRS